MQEEWQKFASTFVGERDNQTGVCALRLPFALSSVKVYVESFLPAPNTLKQL